MNFQPNDHPITDPHGTFDLHVGLPADQVERFMSDEFLTVTHVESGRRPGKYAIGADDGRTSWEQWWEAPWDFAGSTDASDHDPESIIEPEWEKGHHVVIRCENIASAIENFAWLWHEGFTFIPARFKGSHGTIGVVSEAEDWAEQFVAFNVKQQWRFEPSLTEFPEVKG